MTLNVSEFKEVAKTMLETLDKRVTASCDNFSNFLHSALRLPPCAIVKPQKNLETFRREGFDVIDILIWGFVHEKNEVRNWVTLWAQNIKGNSSMLIYDGLFVGLIVGIGLVFPQKEDICVECVLSKSGSVPMHGFFNCSEVIAATLNPFFINRIAEILEFFDETIKAKENEIKLKLMNVLRQSGKFVERWRATIGVERL